MRLFLAIDLPPEVKGHLRSVQSEWSKSHHPHRPAWTRTENLHLTVKFLGEVQDPTAARLLARIKDLPPAGPFPLRTGPMEYFPPRGPVRILATQLLGDTPRLLQLVDALESLAELEGFPRERRRFKPHVTIGRSRTGLPGHLRSPRTGPPFAPEPSEPFLVHEVLLFESRLLRTGPEYVKLASFPV
jgi:2'-5' RNA ligase